MKKGTEDKGIDNIITSEPEESTHPQNGNSRPSDWRELLEREKLELEIAQIEAETEELKKPFYKRQAYLQFSIPAVISLLAVLASLYFGVLDRNIKGKNEEIKQKAEAIQTLNDQIKEKTANLQQQKEDGEKELARLGAQINDLQATTDREKKDKGELELINKRLQTEEAALQGRIDDLGNRVETLNTSKSDLETVVGKLKTDLDSHQGEIKNLNRKVIRTRIEGPLRKFLVVSDKEKKLGEQATYGKVGITEFYQESNSRDREIYEEFLWEEALDNNKDLRSKLRIAALSYSLSKNEKWKNEFESLTNSAVTQALRDLKRTEEKGALKFLSDLEDIERNGNLVITALDVLNEKAKPISAPQIRRIFSLLEIENDLIRKSPVFFCFLEAGLTLIDNDNNDIRINGLKFISTLAGRSAQAVFLNKLFSEGKINQDWINSFLFREPDSERHPKNFEGLMKWRNDNQCLLNYWNEENWIKLRADNRLLLQLMSGGCR